MPNAHAKLGPSAAERWISCPASIRLSESMPKQETSVFAEEGTAAHSLGELKARLAFGKIDLETYEEERHFWILDNKRFVDTDESLAEMDRHTDAYVELIRERMALYPSSIVLLEQRLETGIPGCWGTGDAVIVSPVHIEVIDFKYGKGVEVLAEGNPQLRLYGLGALRTYGDLIGDLDTVRVTVHQPRLDHVLTEELSSAELVEWADTVAAPAAELALGDDAPFGPSDKACHWCPASGRCQAQTEAVFDAADFDSVPDFLSPEEIGDIFDKLPLIREWLKAFEEKALTVAYSEGQKIPGYKVVLSGGKRTIPNPDEAIVHLVNELGYKPEQVVRSTIRGLGELEKLMGKKDFAIQMADFIKPPTGKPALVRESDKRPSINPGHEAQKDFDNEEDL